MMKKTLAYLQAAPILLLMITFALIPCIYIFVLSFMQTGETGNIVFAFTLDNYKRIFEPVILKVFAVSMGTAFITSILSLLIAYPFAYFTGTIFKKRSALIILLVMVPFWTSSLLRTYGFIIFFRANGIINSFLLWAGVIDEPLRLLYNNKSVILGMVYMLLPFMILPIYNSVEKVDHSLMEAARDLGASGAKTFFTVTLPLTLPGIFGGFTLVFIPSVGLFFISDLLGGAKAMLLGNLIQNQVLSARNYPFGAALSVIMFIAVISLVTLYKKLAGLEMGFVRQ